MIALYSPDVPPLPGGVADQTLALARALEAAGYPPLVLARRGDAARFAPLPCETGIGPLEAPGRARGARALLLQYVPFLYARRGVAPALFRLAGACRSAGLPLAVLLHEPYVPLTRLPWLVTGPLQRLQLRRLLGGASRVYTPVPRWAVCRWRSSWPPRDCTICRSR